MPLGLGKGTGFFLSRVEAQKPIWIPHESQVLEPHQVTSGESKWALSDEFGNYSLDFSSA